jgi:hypothetical protein
LSKTLLKHRNKKALKTGVNTTKINEKYRIDCNMHELACLDTLKKKKKHLSISPCIDKIFM